MYPREAILLLRGETREDEIIVREIIIPPRATYGFIFSAFDSFMLPIDLTIVGTAHSHPSGSLRPSITDMNVGFFGRIMVILAYPFESEENVRVYDGEGKRLPLKIVKSD